MVDLGPSLQSELPLPAAAPLPGGTRTMKTLIRSALALPLPAVLAAQPPAAAPPANPITGAFKARIGGLSRNIAQAFDSIPESKFGYKPTPAQLSIGFIAQHVASDNYLFCDQFGEKKSSLPEKDTATPDSVKATWPKDTLVAKLKASFAFCQRTISSAISSGRRSPASRRRTPPPPIRSRRPGPRTRWWPSSRRRSRSVRMPWASSRTANSPTRSPSPSGGILETFRGSAWSWVTRSTSPTTTASWRITCASMASFRLRRCQDHDREASQLLRPGAA